MLQLYWGFLIGGMLFALITIVFGDLFSNGLHGVFDFLSMNHLHFLQPMVFVGGITVLGGSGILLTKYSAFTGYVIFVLSVLIAILISILVYFFYVKAMENSENSSGYSIMDFVGKIGEVTVPIPAKGYGEVVMKLISGYTNQIAASFDHAEIADGSRVVVVEVIEDTLYVSPID